jgi:hypothetical protein
LAFNRMAGIGSGISVTFSAISPRCHARVSRKLAITARPTSVVFTTADLRVSLRIVLPPSFFMVATSSRSRG